MDTLQDTLQDATADTLEDVLADTPKFGVVGRKLGHSWSPQIHAALGTQPYDTYEVEPEDFAHFVLSGDLRGMNVTIPYKVDAWRLADKNCRSAAATRLGAANTLVRDDDGLIWAYNTDLPGFAWMLRDFCVNKLGKTPREVLTGKEALVLGTGGASVAVAAALEDAGAFVFRISRTGEHNYENLVELHREAALMVNCTPVGMYPNCPDSPVSAETLDSLPYLAGVLDIVYNPAVTGLCLAAERVGLRYQTGLAMLVAQAFYAAQLFQGRELDEELIPQIIRSIENQTKNVVLIGMPGVGKTTTGRSLARALNRPFVDLDEAIELEAGKAPADIIREDGEDAFRAIETQVCGQYGSRWGSVIACGGGVVTRPENYALLHQNGTIVLLQRDLEGLSTEGRPVSQDRGLEQLAAERGPLYQRWSDLVLDCTGSSQGDARAIRERLGL